MLNLSTFYTQIFFFAIADIRNKTERSGINFSMNAVFNNIQRTIWKNSG
jgi:hypothetical protein